MQTYKATSANSTHFRLTKDDVLLGELIYQKWYSFNAEIVLPNYAKYDLFPKGFWGTTIELKQHDHVLLDFKMGWKGIVFNSNINGENKEYLFRQKGLLGSKYVLIDTGGRELFGIELDFKWNQFGYDYTIETSEDFERFFGNKELFLLTSIHCVNYYLTMMASA